jgi:hypothetical protein
MIKNLSIYAAEAITERSMAINFGGEGGMRSS